MPIAARIKSAIAALAIHITRISFFSVFGSFWLVIDSSSFGSATDPTCAGHEHSNQALGQPLITENDRARSLLFVTFHGGHEAAPAQTLVGGVLARVAAQPAERMRRIGMLMPFDENDPAAKTRLSFFTQALADLGWTDGRNVRMDLLWSAVTPIGYERSPRSWSVCNPTSS